MRRAASGESWRLRDHVGERLPREQLHHDERLAVHLAGVEDRDDVRVRERGGGTGLGLEPRPDLGIAGQVGTQQLHRDRTPEAAVGAGAHLAHPALADDLSKFVAPGQLHVELRSRHGVRVVPRF